MASIFSATGISLSLFVSLIAEEPEPELFKDPKETVVPPLPTVTPLESEKSFYYFGESLRQAMQMIFKKGIRGSCQDLFDEGPSNVVRDLPNPEWALAESFKDSKR